MFTNSEKNNEYSLPQGSTNYVSSPYLSINPNYLNDADDYILLQDAAPTRSRVQVMFSVVGSAAVCGAALGGLDSLRFTGMKLLSGKAERMQTTSAVLKNGGRIASSFGSVAVLYYACSIISEKSRGVDDEWNTVIGGAAAGALYSLPGILNVKKFGEKIGHDLDQVGFIRKNFMRLPKFGRFCVFTGIGLIAGGLLGLYKSQAADYIRTITKRD